MLVAGEVNALKAGAKNAEEERMNMEGQYKKMRKFIRQSVMQPHNFATAAVMAASNNSRDRSESGGHSNSNSSALHEIEQQAPFAFSTADI